MKIVFVQDALYLGTILKCPQADHVRCCGVSVSSVTGEVSNEFSSPALVRISKSVASDSNEETTDVNFDFITSTTEGNLLDSPTTTELDEATENFPGDAFTTEPSVNEIESTTENEITTTESATEVVHHDGEIINNVMIFYPSEMSGKPHAKPEDMPVDANEFRIHDDTMGTDLHLIYPTNSTSAAVETQTTEAFATTIKIITPSVESATSTDAPEAKISVVTPSQESPTTDVPSIETLTSPTETTDLKPEESELANQIENTNKPRYKRRKLKRKPFLKTSTTKKVPTEATTPIPAYKLQSRYRNSFVKTKSDTEAKSEENLPTTTEKSNVVAETTTRRAHLQYLKLYRSRNHLADVQPLKDTSGEAEHEQKISVLHSILMETANASSVHNLTDFLIQRQQNEQQLNARRNILSSYRTPRPNDLSIAPETSTTTLTAIQSTEADTTTETVTEARTTTESPVSAPMTSLRERFSRRRIPLQRTNRVRSTTSPAPITTTTEVSTTTTFASTLSSDVQSPLNGIRGILRRRRPTTRAPPIELNSFMTAESVTPENNVQKIRRRTKIDRMSSSKRKLMESLQRKRPASTTESSFVDPLLLMLQRKRLKTTTTERSVTSNPTRKYRRRKTTTTQSTTEATTATAREIGVKSSEEVQPIETSSVEPIEITITTTESTTTTTPTTTPIPTEVHFQPTEQPSLAEIEPENKVNNAMIHPIPAPKEYTEIRRPHAPTTFPVEEQPQLTEFKPPTPLLTKTATFPDMRLPIETMEPFHREPAGTKILHRETIISPQSPPSQLIPTNHIGQSSSPSEAFMRPLQTLMPTNQHPVNFQPPTASFPQHAVEISPIHSSHRFAINPSQHIPPAQPHPPRYFINANQNGALANHHYHRFAMPNFNAGQSQQRPVPYIDHANPFGHYNLRFNFN